MSTKEEDFLIEKTKHSNHQKELENLKAKLKKRAQSDCEEFILVLEKSFGLRKKVNF